MGRAKNERKKERVSNPLYLVTPLVLFLEPSFFTAQRFTSFLMLYSQSLHTPSLFFSSSFSSPRLFHFKVYCLNFLRKYFLLHFLVEWSREGEEKKKNRGRNLVEWSPLAKHIHCQTNNIFLLLFRLSNFLIEGPVNITCSTLTE